MDFSLLLASYRPPSAVEKEVYETMMRDEPARRPQRRVADCIVRDYPTKHISDMIDREDINVDDAITKGLRLLHFAAFRHNVEVLLLLLDYGADPNLMDDVGYTPLHLCAEKGYSDFIRILLSYGARLRFTEINPGDKSFGDPPRACAADEPLRLAIRNSEHETALLLLKHGANPSATYYLGQEINMVDPTDTKSLELLLRFGADPNARDRQSMTPLMKACRNPEAIDATYLLISYGADVNAMTNEDQKTPLHYAVLSGNLSLVEILVFNGARVQFSKNYSKPPPHYFAVLRGHVEILVYLLDNGADVNFESAVVGSALHIALTERIPNKNTIVNTLLERGANPNAIILSDKGPLLKPPIGEYFHACEQPQSELVRMLLKYGARVILQGQRDHPLGIVKVIHRLHLGLNPEVMALVIEAAEKFSISFIEQSPQLSDEHKELLLAKALKPFPLVNIAIFKIRESIMRRGTDYVSAISSFPIPLSLRMLLLFQEQG